MQVNRLAFTSASSEPAPDRGLTANIIRNGSGQSFDAVTTARHVAATVGEWDVSEAVAVERDAARGASGRLSASASASGDMSLVITPGDSVSQQRGPPPKQARYSSLTCASTPVVYLPPFSRACDSRLGCGAAIYTAYTSAC